MNIKKKSIMNFLSRKKICTALVFCKYVENLRKILKIQFFGIKLL